MSFYESSAFVGTLLVGLYLLLGLALGLTAWSVLRSFSLRSRAKSRKDAIGRRIAWGVAALLIATLGLSYGLSSAEPLTVNGQTYDDAFWLRASDVLIGSSAVLILVAVVCVVVGMSGLSRRLK